MVNPSPALLAPNTSGKRIQLPFWLFTISAIIALTLPTLIQDGMFQDAMLYTDVAHNLSHGIGTFWMPQYSKLNVVRIDSFHEQPPLVFGIQALFFRVLGDSIYVERFYVLVTTFLNAFLIVQLWKTIFKEDAALSAVSWLPVLLWISIPICFWSFSNNMNENTMSIFTLAAVLMAYKAHFSRRNSFALWLLAGSFVFLATFSKGVPGFFPISVPVVCWLCYGGKSWWKALLGSLVMIALPLAVYFLLFQFPASAESMHIYVVDRLLHRIHQDPTADYRLEIIWRLFTELLPPLFLVAIISLICFLKKTPLQWRRMQRHFYCMLLIGVSGAAPLALTMVQKGFYLVPALPYCAVALAVLAAPIIAEWPVNFNTHRNSYKMLTGAFTLLLIGGLIVTWQQKGKFSREADTMHDVYTIGNTLPRFTILGAPEKVYADNDLVLQGFFVRYFYINIDPYNSYNYLIAYKTMSDSITAANVYRKVPLDTKKYDLYQRITQ